LGFVLLAIVFVLFACVFFPRSIVVLGFVVLDGWFSCVGVLVCLVFCVVLWLWGWGFVWWASFYGFLCCF